MPVEQSLVIIKPGNSKYCLEIFECLQNQLGEFSRTRPFHICNVPEEIIKEHYQGISDLPIYEPTIRAFVRSKEGIVLAVYSGKEMIRRVRDAIGNTDPQKAKQGTVRAVFARDTMEDAAREIRYLNNVIHASSSVEDSEREIKLWEKYLFRD